MRQLSAEGEHAIDGLAEQHGFSPAAVRSMLESVIDGNGRMAQFDHPEFGGSGQWMKGGMTMVSNLFDHQMKARIDRLCSDLAKLVSDEPESASLFVPVSAEKSGEHWPANLGPPDSTGAQNDVRYAYFAEPHRLAIEIDGHVTVYDTLDHAISGFGQQQSRDGSLTFRSQHGVVDVATLPVVSAAAFSQPTPARASPTTRQNADGRSTQHHADIFTSIERLGELRAKGLLTEEEFTAKKTELLGRL